MLARYSLRTFYNFGNPLSAIACVCVCGWGGGGGGGGLVMHDAMYSNYVCVCVPYLLEYKSYIPLKHTALNFISI